LSYASPSTHSSEEGAHVAYLRAVRAHPLLVGFIVLVALVTAVVWQHSRTPSYEATAQVLVTPVADESAYVGLPAIVTSASADPSRTVQTATSILESPAAAALAASNLGSGWTKQAVARSVSVQPRGESDVISVTGKAGSGAQAAALAAAYARAALAVHAKLLGAEAKLQVEQLQARARRLTAAESSEASQIGSQLAALNAVAAGHDPNFSLLQLPLPPGSPSGTSKAVIFALALLAGLIIAVGAAVITDYLNRRARDEDEILSVYPLPVLARVPILPRNARDASSPDRVPPGVREAFRTLQPQLPQMRSNDGRAVMFTSASARDGKTSAAINFAFVLSAAGFSVILFDFDLRRPDIGRRLGVNSDFMDLFRSDAQLEDLLKQPPGAPDLRVISSRAQGGETTVLVDAVARRLPELLRRARQLADYVIVDTPPLGQISDGLRAAMVVDDIVLVARPGNTSRIELERTRELLDRMDHTPSGVVVIGLQTVGDAFGTYGLEPGAPANGGAPASGAIDEALPQSGARRRSDRRRRADADEDEPHRAARRSEEGGREARRSQANGAEQSRSPTVIDVRDDSTRGAHDADAFGAERGKPITQPPA
jgi:Mrp family chromosome partitioning ATPase